jgi:Domain of unknown function (DUF4440)
MSVSRLSPCQTMIAALLIIAAAARANAAPPSDLRRQIARADSVFFGALFDRCDSSELATLVTDDFEFYHDKGGQVAHSKAQFVERIRDSCERQAAGLEPKTRRVLIAGTLEAHVIGEYGALETGRHRFYHRRPRGNDTPTERARFSMLWKRVDDRWLLARVFSFDHVSSTGRSAPLLPPRRH